MLTTRAGHTIVGLVLSNARVVHKVTIVPRGRAGGYMIALPKEDQMLLSKEDMKEQLAGLMGDVLQKKLSSTFKPQGLPMTLSKRPKWRVLW